MTWFYKFRLSKKTESDAPCRILHIFLCRRSYSRKISSTFWSMQVKVHAPYSKASGAPRDRNTRVACSLFDGRRYVFVLTHAHLVGMPGPYAKYSAGQVTWRGMYRSRWLGRVVGVAISSWRQGMRERVLLSVQQHSYSIPDELWLQHCIHFLSTVITAVHCLYTSIFLQGVFKP